MSNYSEIRDPVHGYHSLNRWERDIINHTAFQRLRSIRQLGLTDMVYPGAMHSRFEHSLGVMNTATSMFDGIVRRRKDFLKSELNFTDGGLEKDRVLVGISSLLHDIGYGPFSLNSESLMPADQDSGRPFALENYSAAIALLLMRDVIESHPLNQNYGIKAQDVADFLNGNPGVGRSLLWRGLIKGNLDADRADYLLRDSHHIGVSYGRFDLIRLILSMTVVINPDTSVPTIAVDEGGIHCAEALIFARYMMFTRIYFHRTRRAYHLHLTSALKSLLAEEQKKSGLADKSAYPPPDSPENIEAYLKWNDWRALSLISGGKGGPGGDAIRARNHYRCVHETSEIPNDNEIDFFEQVLADLDSKKLKPVPDMAEKSYYRFDSEAKNISALLSTGKIEKVKKLYTLSSAIKGTQAVTQRRIYVPFEHKEKALEFGLGYFEKFK